MENKLDQMLSHNEYGKIFSGIVGIGIYALGLNLFIVPLNLYSGGLMGICQLIRTLLVSGMGLSFGSFDIAGAIYYIINIPLIIWAYKAMDRIFVRKMLIMITSMTIFLSIIAIPKTPLVEEPLTGALIGGIICGFGVGVYLRAGCSGGGLEVVGIYLTRKMRDFSLGKMNLIVNTVVYALCLLLFDPSVVIYSIIYSVLSSLTMDKIHSQNIRVEAIIISKKDSFVIEDKIMKQLNRGITYWRAKGGYTGEEVDVMYTVLSKFEVPTLRRIVYESNPQAFMVIKEGLSVDGNFIKRL